MGLERIIGRVFLMLSLLTIPTIMNKCDREEDVSPQPVTIEDTVEVDTSHVGMIQGQVFSSKIEDNQVVYEPYQESEDAGFDEGAYVWIIEEPQPWQPEFETMTTSDGYYSIDNIPTGTYTVEALREFRDGWFCGDDYYANYIPGDRKSVTVIKQQTTTVPDLELLLEPVLKGKIYDDETKTAPFANKEVGLYGGYSNPNEYLDSTTTSSDGSYAFERGGKDRFCLKSPGTTIYFEYTNAEESNYISHQYYNIVEKDAYVAE